MLINVGRRSSSTNIFTHVALNTFCYRNRTFTSTAILALRSRHIIAEGRHTNVDSADQPPPSVRLPFYLETGYSIFAKRPSRPFPPPFTSKPSGSFSDPLTTHDRVNYRTPKVDGRYLQGVTNGDDAVIISPHANFLAVNDGVGAWAQKERGHAALWSRLIAHYWALEVENTFEDAASDISFESLDPKAYLQAAYEKTKAATTGVTPPKSEDTDSDDHESDHEHEPESTANPSRKPTKEKHKDKDGKETNDILGTTTATSALLHHKSPTEPIILATQLGDCAVFIIRPPPPGSPILPPPADASDPPADEETDTISKHLLYKTVEQWHWFDCPRQLGTNSPDTPLEIAVTDTIPIQKDDIVLLMSDGVTDNLWEHEITAQICRDWQRWQTKEKGTEDGVVFMARELMNAARVVAQDPYAESPYMERALDEGIAAEGGKLDDISVVIGVCRKRD